MNTLSTLLPDAIGEFLGSWAKENTFNAVFSLMMVFVYAVLRTRRTWKTKKAIPFVVVFAAVVAAVSVIILVADATDAFQTVATATAWVTVLGFVLKLMLMITFPRLRWIEIEVRNTGREHVTTAR